MGNTGSKVDIRFKDNYHNSEVDRGGCRVKCNRACHFTQLTQSTFGSEEELKVTCKIYALNDSPIAFGIVPAPTTSITTDDDDRSSDNEEEKQEQLDAACATALLGTEEIPGSIGCHVVGGNVLIMKDGEVLPFGPLPASEAPVPKLPGTATPPPPAPATSGDDNPAEFIALQLTLKKNKISFAVNGRELSATFDNSNGDSSAAEDGASLWQPATDSWEQFQKLNHFDADSYFLGVSLTEKDQEVEVYPTCDFTFKPLWTSGRIFASDMLFCKQGTSFTYYSDELIQPGRGQKFTIHAKFRKNCDELVGIGLLNDQGGHHDKCKKALVGKFPGSIAFLFKKKELMIYINGDQVFHAEGNTSDPCTATMKLVDGRIAFEFDGRELDCDKLKAARFTTAHRVGIALSHAEQLCEMRGGLNPNCVEKSDDPMRFKDNMRSIDCNSEDLVAIAVKSMTATVYTQKFVRSQDAGEEVEFRMLKNPGNAPIFFGLLDRNERGHAATHLGDADLNGSLGFTNSGQFIMEGKLLEGEDEGGEGGGGRRRTSSPCGGVLAGDLVKIRIEKNCKVRFFVNGQDATPPALAEKSFPKRKFRFAVSFTREGQAVKLGDEPLDGDQKEFIQKKTIDLRESLMSITSTEDAMKAAIDEPMEDEEQRAEMLKGIKDFAFGPLGGAISWKDNMRSIDCDDADIVGISIKKFTATLYTKHIVHAEMDHVQEDEIHIRVLRNPAGSAMLVGIMDGDDNTGHGNCFLGQDELKNSIGWSNTGQLIYEGANLLGGGGGEEETGGGAGRGLGFLPGDLLTIRFTSTTSEEDKGHKKNTLQFFVNGKNAFASEEQQAALEGLASCYSSKFRYATSFTVKDQAVKIEPSSSSSSAPAGSSGGGGTITVDQQAFLRKKSDLNIELSFTAVPTTSADDRASLFAKDFPTNVLVLSGKFGALAWKDNMRSIDCDSADIIAVGVFKTTATLYTKHIVQCHRQTQKEEEGQQQQQQRRLSNDEINIRILSNPDGAKMLVGIMDGESEKNHEKTFLGDSAIANSYGLTNTGQLVHDSKFLTGPAGTKPCRGFIPGDVVTIRWMAVSEELHFLVNGEDAAPPLRGISFNSFNFRYGVTFTATEQAVKIISPGEAHQQLQQQVPSSLTDEEMTFCSSKKVPTPILQVCQDETERQMELSESVSMTVRELSGTATPAAAQIDTNSVSFRDNMRSVDCNAQGSVAVSLKKFTATSFLKKTYDPATICQGEGGDQKEEEEEVHFRILSNPGDAPLVVGVLDEDHSGHANSHVGEKDLKGECSIGLTNSGLLIYKGETLAWKDPSSTSGLGCRRGLGFLPGDTVTLKLTKRSSSSAAAGPQLNILVNGQDAAPALNLPVISSVLPAAAASSSTWYRDILGQGKFRFGVSFTSQGQAACIVNNSAISTPIGKFIRNFCTRKGVPVADLDAISNGELPLKEGSSARTERLAAVGDIANQGKYGHLRWKDNMRSIDCDGQDIVAVSVKPFTATLYTQYVIRAGNGDRHEVSFRILANPHNSSLLVVGLLDEDTEGHANNQLGSEELRHSCGLTNTGEFLHGGRPSSDVTVTTTPTTASAMAGSNGNIFQPGDLVTLKVRDSTLRIFVNGKAMFANGGYFKLSRSKYRFAVTFSARGQAVKIGADDLSDDDRTFCREKDCPDPRDTPLITPLNPAVVLVARPPAGGSASSTPNKFRQYSSTSGMSSPTAGGSVTSSILTHLSNVGTSATPNARLFKRCRTAENGLQAVEWLLNYRNIPATRPDLAAIQPDDDDVDATLAFLSEVIPEIKSASPGVRQLIEACSLTDDDLIVLVAYQMDHPYPIAKWLNGYLFTVHASSSVVASAIGQQEANDCIGPYFTMLHRAMEKLPQVTAPGCLVVPQTKGVPALEALYNSYSQAESGGGQKVNFWGMTTFEHPSLLQQELLNSELKPIVYTCSAVTGVDLEEFTPPGKQRRDATRAAEGEQPSSLTIVPLCPAMFVLKSASKKGEVDGVLSLDMEEKDASRFAYVAPQ